MRASTLRIARVSGDRPLTILVVDAQPASAAGLLKILHNRGHFALEAQTCADAREMAQAIRFDALICSPASTAAAEFLQLLHDVTGIYSVTGIMLGPPGSERQLAESRAAGYIAHLVRPVNPEKLTALLNAITVGAVERYASEARGRRSTGQANR